MEKHDKGILKGLVPVAKYNEMPIYILDEVPKDEIWFLTNKNFKIKKIGWNDQVSFWKRLLCFILGHRWNYWECKVLFCKRCKGVWDGRA